MGLAVEIIKKCWLTGHNMHQSESSERAEIMSDPKINVCVTIKDKRSNK